MKINPSDKLQPIAKPAGPDPKGKAGDGNFASVFEQKIGPAGGAAAQSVQPLSAAMPPSMTIMNGPDKPAQMAHGLLDRLDQYRQLLGDPGKSLREIAPALEQLRKQVDDAASMMARMDESDPVRSVLQETILVIGKEVERFNLGGYVED